MNGNCSNCKNYEHSFGICQEGYILISDNENSCLGKKYAICKKNHNDIMKRWWDENGKLIQKECAVLECYEPTEFDCAIDNILKIGRDVVNKTVI